MACQLQPLVSIIQLLLTFSLRIFKAFYALAVLYFYNVSWKGVCAVCNDKQSPTFWTRWQVLFLSFKAQLRLLKMKMHVQKFLEKKRYRKLHTQQHLQQEVCITVWRQCVYPSHGIHLSQFHRAKKDKTTLRRASLKYISGFPSPVSSASFKSAQVFRDSSIKQVKCHFYHSSRNKFGNKCAATHLH